MISIRKENYKRLRPRIDPERAAGPTGVPIAHEREMSAPWSRIRRIDVPAEAAHLPHCIRRPCANHESDGFGFEKPHAIEFALVQQHPRIARQIRCSGEKS